MSTATDRRELDEEVSPSPGASFTVGFVFGLMFGAFIALQWFANLTP